jgi:DNA (cytosine-5)-methyltransferase 1
VENSPLLVQRGLAVVLTDLAKMGFDARWGVVSAENAKFVHKRDRLWVCAYSKGANAPNATKKPNRKKQRRLPRQSGGVPWGDAFCGLCTVDDGVAKRLDELKAIGNGQVPAVAALAWRLLTDGE